MTCHICKTEMNKAFDSIIRKKYKVSYFKCPKCDFLQTEKPYWLSEAYEYPINAEDTGYVRRNIRLSKIISIVLVSFFDKTKKFLDYGSGYGIFPRLMRDYGLDFYWQDKFTDNLFCRYFEYTNQPIEAITCFECFEHFDNPIIEIEKILSISKNIIFSTVLMPKSDEIPPQSWWYYGFNHGQHISLYSLKTLKFIAKKYNLNLYSNKANFHILSEKKINSLWFRVVYKIGTGKLADLWNHFLTSKTEIDSTFIQNQK